MAERSRAPRAVPLWFPDPLNRCGSRFPSFKEGTGAIESHTGTRGACGPVFGRWQGDGIAPELHRGWP